MDTIKNAVTADYLYNMGVKSFLPICHNSINLVSRSYKYPEVKRSHPDDAADFFWKASEYGHEPSILCLMKMYIMGYGMIVDLNKIFPLVLRLIQDHRISGLILLALLLKDKFRSELSGEYFQKAYSLLLRMVPEKLTKEYFMELDKDADIVTANYTPHYTFFNLKVQEILYRKRSFSWYVWALLYHMEVLNNFRIRPEVEGVSYESLNKMAIELGNEGAELLFCLDIAYNSESIFLGHNDPFSLSVNYNRSGSILISDPGELNIAKLCDKIIVNGYPSKVVFLNWNFCSKNLMFIDKLVELVKAFHTHNIECHIMIAETENVRDFDLEKLCTQLFDYCTTLQLDRSFTFLLSCTMPNPMLRKKKIPDCETQYYNDFVYRRAFWLKNE